MPGIAGIITKLPRERVEPQLRRMVEALRHEPFYTAGTWIDESLGVYAGWTAHQNSFASAMPVMNKRGDVTLIFSGEEYSDSATVCRREENGHGVKAKGPAYLVQVYEDDPAFPTSLNGLFHGLVADRACGRVTLFNDRYGMHRLYYHEAKEAFYFAAEAKAILAVRPDLRAADIQGLGEFVSCGSVLEDRTLFKGIFALPAASVWAFRGGSIDRKTIYFQPREWEEQSTLEPEAYYQELQSALLRDLSRYFNGQQRVGMTLTGGFDTRVLMAWHKPSPGSLPCYTFGGTLRDCQDVRIARRVAKLCQQPHEVITVGSDFLSRFPHYAERSIYLTEGGVDVYRASDLYVSEKAREIAPVKVVGTYGSEILRHMVTFKPQMPTPGLFRSDFLPHVQQATKTYAEIRNTHPVTFAAFRQSPWNHHGVLALEQSQLTVRSPYLNNNFVRTVYRAPETGKEDVRLRLIAGGSPALGQILTDHGAGKGSGPLTAATVRGFRQFTVRAEYAYDYGMPQWVAPVDRLLAPLHLERLFLGRHKFLHFRTWYRDSLAEYVRQMLLDSKTLARPFLEPTGVKAIVEGHLAGNRNYTTEIHKLLTLELLYRNFLDPQ